MKRVYILTSALVVFAYLPVSATIINIPDDYPTIQQGIDASANGDTVLVHPGTYVENVNFNGHNIVLGSLFLITGNTNYISSTIIDGDSLGAVVYFEDGEDSICVIKGFTIQNGNSSWGGGIVCNYQSNPTISNNIIVENLGWFYGGGISCLNSSSPQIMNNKIEHNTVYRSSSVDGHGGGIFCPSNSNSIIINNVISGNTVIGSGHGAALGGGIFCRESSPIIANNVIIDNSVHAYTAWAGGVFCGIYSSPFIVNNILWADTAEYYPELFVSNSSSPIITYNDIQGGYEGEGNIDIDPLFRDPDNGDFHLKADSCGDVYNSPCIDAGDPAIFDSMLGCDWGLGELRSDMGAYGGARVPTDVDEEQTPEIPMQFLLSQNYPNPFNAFTIIQYNLPSASDVTIDIYDILGGRVGTLVQGEQPAGYHQVTWDASEVSSGIYFYRIQAGEYGETRKMVLLK